jgi:hypothetical protein
VRSGQDLGTITALVISPQIAEHLGWEYIFVTFALLAGLWVALFSVCGASTPEGEWAGRLCAVALEPMTGCWPRPLSHTPASEDTRITAAEREYIVQHRQLSVPDMMQTASRRAPASRPPTPPHHAATARSQWTCCAPTDSARPPR